MSKITAGTRWVAEDVLGGRRIWEVLGATDVTMVLRLTRHGKILQRQHVRGRAPFVRVWWEVLPDPYGVTWSISRCCTNNEWTMLDTVRLHEAPTQNGRPVLIDDWVVGGQCPACTGPVHWTWEGSGPHWTWEGSGGHWVHDIAPRTHHEVELPTPL